ncbi:MAG: sigma-70 family RNA polymerase sigma factor [Planctomycetaceae bacterium]|jgi:DNA-directed RNA polymerase specialized sigma24 family protein|nr:sigma-70 family RNA polymerase sigma factor [Planctomycetaceae bacterium]MBT6485961.1 sigma-70 family RNA polymerase sigma factor [Planctomycetaceae bacterium]MBT6497887.1 sigma-70 family RNA polymerase sigma factor [Planctomycetaceae bacterium]
MFAMNSSSQSDVPIRQNNAFATTRWSIVISAGRDSSPNSTQALESLCEAYWYPLYAYVRRRVPDVSEAQDLTQAFFVELLEKNYVGTATPDRGRFRAFLLTAFKHFLSKQWEKAKAQKRGGGRAPISLDFDAADSSIRIEPESGLTAEQFYDQQWAITLLGQIMQRMEKEFDGDGKSQQFHELKGFIIGDHAGTTYAQAAEKLNMTEAAAKQAGSRMRRRYRELLREEIAQTVQGPNEVDDEIRNLFAILQL